jgi:hypothetical protein
MKKRWLCCLQQGGVSRHQAVQTSVQKMAAQVYEHILLKVSVEDTRISQKKFCTLLSPEGLLHFDCHA